MDDIDMTISSSTEVIAGEHTICTPGTIDAHVHYISPQQVTEALCAGTTTMIGGGTGPADGTNATTCTPGAWNIHRMMEAAEQFPVNMGFLCKGNDSRGLYITGPARGRCLRTKTARGLGYHPRHNRRGSKNSRQD